MSIRNPTELGIIKGELPAKSFLAGLDEVGRGPLAGPVVACCTFLKWDIFTSKKLLKFFKFLSKLGIKSSKLISSQKRMEILNHFQVDPLKIFQNTYYRIRTEEDLELGFSLSSMGPEEIDRINILNASLNSMAISFKTCRSEKLFGEVLIDGNKVPKNLGINLIATAIVDGDSKSLMIALASIFAKEYRDQQMRLFAQKYPQYNFQKNMGYATKDHRRAIKNFGITPIHRKSFRGANNLTERLS